MAIYIKTSIINTHKIAAVLKFLLNLLLEILKIHKYPCFETFFKHLKNIILSRIKKFYI